MVEQLGEYEYAGFNYQVTRTTNCDGRVINLKPVSGQHPAASKDKHIQAARQCYLDEHPRERA